MAHSPKSNALKKKILVKGKMSDFKNPLAKYKDKEGGVHFYSNPF